MDTKYILLVLGLLLLIAPGAALDGYAYNQSVSYSACDQDVYQQDIVIHRSTGTAYNETAGGMETWHIYVGEHCREDYGDVRFTNSTGAEFAYYLWPDYTSSSARFAVRLEGADTAGTLTVWYGNPSATTTSDPDATYDLWCDFLDAGEVAAVFDVVGTPSTTYADSVATITCDAREFYQSKKTFSRPARVEFRMADTGYGADHYPSSTGFGVRNQGGGGYHVIREAESGAKYALITCNGGTTSVGAGSSHDLAFQDYQIDWVSGTSASLRKNGVVVSTVSSNIPAGTLPVTFGRFHYVYSGNQMRIDWILVRAYSAAPPAATAFLTGPAPEIPPTAAFTASPTSGTAPLTVQFTDASTSSPTAWAWTFGDGGTSAQQHPSHTYNEPGTYTVNLTATNAGGSDTETKTGLISVYATGPYSVATYADLCKVGTGTDGWTLDADYIQTADIQCPAGANFPRIGLDPGTLFTGTYDGNGYEIQNLRLHYSDFHTGMFIVIGETGIVQNVTLVDVDVSSASSRTGALAGLVLGTVRNCHSSGTVVGADLTGGLIGVLGEYMGTDVGYLESSSSSCTVTQTGLYSTDQGGLVGSMLSGSMVECSATGDVIDGSSAGGLIGIAEGGTISVSRCSAAGNVTAPDGCWSGTGGLIGKMSGSVSVTDCYAAGGVSAPSLVGGLIGNRVGGTISSCYATGQVAATDEYGTAGGLIGGGGGTSSSFWDTETSGQATSDGGVGKTTAEMKTIATFAGWNIATPAEYTDEVWFIVEGEDYPRLAWEGVPIVASPVAGFSADPVLGPAPLTVQFTDESMNEPESWVWQFGDGQPSFAQHPSHTYMKPGTYTVSLEAANSAGSDLVTEPDLITVQISDAVTFVGTPTTGGSPLTVRFTVVNGDPTWSYLWSFGDGETSTDQNPVHRYTTRADTANFTVTLTITQNGETETIERPDYIRIDTVGVDTFTATQQMNIESVVTVGAISSIIAGIIVVVFVL